MIGIYKITSPTKKVYIGQSTNIEKRFNTYKLLHCKSQTALYRSLLKHGVDKHKFEILFECSIEELNDKERYYQDIFSVMDKNGLNCRLTKSSDKNGKLSDEAKMKIRLGNKGKILSDKTKLKISIANKGKILSEEHKNKLSEAGKGKKHSKEILNKISKARIGKKHSEEAIEKMSYLILNTETFIFYFGTKQAAESINMNISTLKNQLNGRYKNKTPFIYV